MESPCNACISYLRRIIDPIHLLDGSGKERFVAKSGGVTIMTAWVFPNVSKAAFAYAATGKDPLSEFDLTGVHAQDRIDCSCSDLSRRSAFSLNQDNSLSSSVHLGPGAVADNVSAKDAIGFSGLMTDLSTSVYPFGPGVHTMRARLPIYDLEMGHRDVHAVSGTSIDAGVAATKCTMEAVERLAAAMWRPSSVRAPHGLRVLSFQDFALDIQEPANHVSRAWSITRNEEVMVPTALIPNPVPTDLGHFGLPSSSDGCASGRSLDDATFRGAMELVERDAYYLAARTRTNLRTFRSPLTEQLDQQAVGMGAHLYFADMTNDIGIAAIHALLIGPNGCAHGASATGDIDTATEKAAIEAVQCHGDLALLRNNPAMATLGATTYAEHHRWTKDDAVTHTRWLRGVEDGIEVASTPIGSLNELVSHLAQQGREILRVELPARFGSAVRVLITGLVPVDPSFMAQPPRFLEALGRVELAHDEYYRGSIFT